MMTVEDLRAQLLDMLRDITNGVLEGLASEQDLGHALQSLFEALSHEAAYIEGMSVLLHVDSSGLDASRRICRRAGLSESLNAHNVDCPGCDGSKTLKAMIEVD